MRRIFQYLIFVSIFLSISFAMNWYIFTSLGNMLLIQQSIWFWLGLIISSLSFLFAMYEGSGKLSSRIVAVAASTWLGIVAITLFMVLAYDILQIFLLIDPNAAGKTIIIMVGILAAVGVVNTRILRTRVVELQSTKLKSDLSIVHISDLHLGTINGKQYLLKVLKRIKALKPNMILITGDLFDNTEQFTNKPFSILDELKAPIILITGNHEHYAGMEDISKVLEENNIRLLRNETMILNDIRVVGIDYTPSRKAFTETLKMIEVDPNKYTILMHHQPMPLEEVSRRGVDLMLAGHTHGGQVFPFTILARLVWKHPSGVYRHRGTYLNTSSGTGTWGPPMRLGTSNEIVFIKLHKFKLELKGQ